MSLHHSAHTIVPHTLNNLVVDVDADNNTVSFVTNGQKTVISDANINFNHSSVSNLVLGKDDFTHAANFKGSVDAVKVYGDSLSDNQIEDEILKLPIVDLKYDEASSTLVNRGKYGGEVDVDQNTIGGDSSFFCDCVNVPKIMAKFAEEMNSFSVSCKMYGFQTKSKNQTIFRKELENNGFMELRMNSESKVEFEISDARIVDLTAVMDSDSVRVRGVVPVNMDIA